MIPYVLIIHEVENYADWKKGFDEAEKVRKAAGELSYQILTYENDVNRVIHYSLWESHVKAKAFFKSEMVIEIRKKLGVKKPSFNYVFELEQGVF